MPAPVRNSIFISYAHADRPRLSAFETHLEALTHRGASIWRDRDLRAGDDWLHLIDERMCEASCALLMVSQAFLASSFIREQELPRLLDLHHRKQLRIFWVPMETSAWEVTRLTEIQAAHDPMQPLWSLAPDMQSKAIVGVCKAVAEHLGQLGTRNAGEIHDILDRVRAAIPASDRLTFGELLPGGRSSLVCTGRRADRDVVVKILLDGPLDRWTDEFRTAVDRAKRLHHECFITLLDDFFIDVPHPVLVLERLPAQPLRDVLARDGRFPVDRVTQMLMDVAGALDLLHREGGVHGVLMSDNVFVHDRNGGLLLSAVSVSSFLSRTLPWQEFLAAGQSAATYLVPEQYYGEPLTALSDQYALGQIALEMLHGVPPVTIQRPADLDTKRRFFEAPMTFVPEGETWTVEHPWLRRILARMLHRSPADRYPTLRDVIRDLQRVEADAYATARHAYAMRISPDAAFFTAFYVRFFERCPDAAPLFGDVAQQAKKLREAAASLLDFNGDREPNTLTAHVAAHRNPGIRQTHFEAFLAAFLETLTAFGATPREIEAWRVVFQPALRYLAPPEAV